MKHLFLESMDINDAMTFVNLRLARESGRSSSRAADTRHFLLSTTFIPSYCEELIITLSHVFLLLFGFLREIPYANYFTTLNGLDVEPVL